ncbi:ATP-binding protein [Streptomyces sp. E11-3]|uniref:ATP-binding protein n=1 Tax=Streptomyces sp. E11-3 TaxID=3110112 RepID=UPI0039816C2A
MRTPEQPDPLWSYGLAIPHAPHAVGVVRATIRGILRAARLTCITDTVELLASELATNAYRHSVAEAYVCIDRVLNDVRVTVWDHGPGTPAPAEAPPDAVSGRGLGIVQACADDWGVRSYPHGKAVWFTVTAKPEGDQA